MERAVSDTQPLPVVETAAPPTVALPVEPPPPPPAAVAPRADRTPLVLGLLAVAAVLAIGLSVLALARRDEPPAPGDPAAAETPTSVPATVEPAPGASAPTTAPAAPPLTASTVAPVRAAPSTRAPTTDDDGDDGKGKRGGKGGD